MNPKWKYVKGNAGLVTIALFLALFINCLPYLIVILGIIFILREEFK